MRASTPYSIREIHTIDHHGKYQSIMMIHNAGSTSALLVAVRVNGRPGLFSIRIPIRWAAPGMESFI